MSENLYRRPGGKTWYGRIQIAGQEHRRSLRTTSRPEAARRLAEWLKELSHEQWTGEARHTWEDAVVKYGIEVLPSLVKPRTQQRYLTSLKQLDEHLRGRIVDDPEPLPKGVGIDRRTIAEIVSRRKLDEVTNATIRRDLTAMSSVLMSVVSWGWRDDNPAKEWDRSVIKERRDPIALPSAADVARAVAVLPAMMGRMVLLARQSGMRENEIVTLEHAQVHAAQGRIDLTRTKTNRPRALDLRGPITDQAVGTIAGTPRHLKSRYVFWHDNGEPFRNFASNFAQQRASHEIRFRFHDLRHLFAVEYLRAGGSLYNLQQQLGHSTIRTTEIYLDFLTPDEKERAKHAPAQMSAQMQRFGTADGA